jgi:hypothetical protein
MNLLELEADQLYKWSDNDAPCLAQAAFVRFAKASAAAVTPVAATRSSAARFPHRALQAVRQAGLQMRPRARSWPQVLPFRELSRPKTANGLRAPGVPRRHQRVSRPSPSGARHLGGDLRDQSRTAAAPRSHLRNCYAQPPRLPQRSAEYGNGRPAAGQYARRLAEAGHSVLTHGRGGSGGRP